MKSPRRKGPALETYERRPDDAESSRPHSARGRVSTPSLSFDQSNVAGARSLG